MRKFIIGLIILIIISLVLIGVILLNDYVDMLGTVVLIASIPMISIIFRIWQIKKKHLKDVKYIETKE